MRLILFCSIPSWSVNVCCHTGRKAPVLSLVVPLNSLEIKDTLMAVVALPTSPAKVSKQAVPSVAWPEGYAGKFGVRLSPSAPAGIGAMGLLRGAPSGFQNGSPL